MTRRLLFNLKSNGDDLAVRFNGGEKLLDYTLAAPRPHLCKPSS